MSAPPRPVLQASALALRYPGASMDVFRDVDLALDRCEVVAVLAPAAPASPACCGCWRGCSRPAPARC